jgi:integrase
MAASRETGLLNARKVETLTEVGRHADGRNLYLLISPNGGKRWTFYYRFGGKRREMGLGSAAKGQVSLAEARERAAEARRVLLAGIDPLSHRQSQLTETRKVPTFGEWADDYLDSHRTKFRNPKHLAQWEMTLRVYCEPIRSIPVDAIDTEAVLSVLQPIWNRVPETASRLRGRLENVLDAAKARGLLTGENPARWRGHLKTLLPARQKLTRGHHAAMPYDALAAFTADLRTHRSMSARALEFCILTACRSSEVLGARWSEVDLQRRAWTIPAPRMKAAREHRVPLSARACEILAELQPFARGDYVFTGNRADAPLSGMAMMMQLRRMKQTDITVHGFRSTFRDWAAEQTSYSHQTCEHALAHQISDKAEAAYRRSDQFEIRRKLMEDWALYATQAAE